MEHYMGLETFEKPEQNLESEIPSFADAELQEFAPSMEVQAEEISEVFNDILELQPENWEKLDVNERVEALQRLENEVAVIEHRPPIVVVAEPLDPGINGYFNGEKIAISETRLMDNSEYEGVLSTLFHEGRHAYQHHNLYSGEVVEQNQEMVNAWRINLDVMGYENGDALVFKTLGVLRYYTQPIEVDARTFADEVMRKLDL